jgi:hypothetical protein
MRHRCKLFGKACSFNLIRKATFRSKDGHAPASGLPMSSSKCLTVPAAVFLLPLAHHRRLGVLLGGMQVDPALARLPDAAPFPHQGPFPEKIPLHAQAVIAMHAAGRMVAFEADRAGKRVWVGD